MGEGVWPHVTHIGLAGSSSYFVKSSAVEEAVISTYASYLLCVQEFLNSHFGTSMYTCV